MTEATCTPVSDPVPAWERERRPDRLGELLECLADLLVETSAQRAGIERLTGCEESVDASQRYALRRLAALERELQEVSLEAASVHQLLQHEHLI